MGGISSGIRMMGATESVTGAASTPSIAVVNAVAAAEGCAPANVPEPLYDAVDPDALDAVVESLDEGRLTFTYQGYEVTVGADGSVNLAG